jgi:hypothetical protein
LSTPEIGNGFPHHYSPDPTLKTPLLPKGIQVLKYLYKAADHNVFSKLKILDILSTNT